MGRVTAVFDNQVEAEEALEELRELEVEKAELAFLTRHDEIEAERNGDDIALGAGRGLLAGAAIGAIFGIMSAAYPSTGMLINAGFLTGTFGMEIGSLLAGALVGGTSGFVAGGIARAGFSRRREMDLGANVEPGNVMVAVETRDNSITASDERVSTIMAHHHGRVYGY